jgi:hypothetical protein
LGYVLWRREILRGFWWGNLNEGENLEDLSANGKTILKLRLKR